MATRSMLAPKAKPPAALGVDLASPKAKSRSSPLGTAALSMLGPSPKATPRSEASKVTPRSEGTAGASGSKGTAGAALGSLASGGTNGASGSTAAAKAIPGAAPSTGASPRGNDSGASPKSTSASSGLGKAGSRALGLGGAAPTAKASSSSGPAPSSAYNGAAGPAAPTPEAVLKFHSAVRWAKPWAEIQESTSGIEMKTMCAEKDPKNGNCVIHIAAQNGHFDIVRELLVAGASVNGQNGKGQTALHMTVEYDFYFLTRLLLDDPWNADREIINQDGHKAILGIDGTKLGKEAWDNPVTILRAATSAEELVIALESLEKALLTAESKADVSKEQLIMVGMAKKKSPITQASWDHKRFMKMAAQF